VTYLLTRAGLEDLPEMIEQEAMLFGADAWSPELMVEEVSHPFSYYLVARERGSEALAGYGGLRAAPSLADAGDIQTLATVADHRKKGVGRMLLRALLEEAHRRGAGDVFLEVRADNPVAQSLYGSEAFFVIDRRVGYYQPEGVDALVMRRRHQDSLAQGTRDHG
jgi:ribosomal-protein-alanine acetyltransferase